MDLSISSVARGYSGFRMMITLRIVLVSSGYALYSKIGVLPEGNLPTSFILDFFQILIRLERNQMMS